MDDKAEKPPAETIATPSSFDLPEIVAAPIAPPSSRAATPSTAPPPLSTVHLLIWVGCAAVYFALVRADIQKQPGVVGVAIVTLLAATTGAAWTALLLVMWRAARQVRFATAPGEWLAAVAGAALAAQVIVHWAPQGLLVGPAALVQAVTVLALVAPLLVRGLPDRWKLVFLVLLALECAAWAVGVAIARGVNVAASVGYTIEASRPLAVLALVVVDRVRGVRHGTLHWIGLAVYLWYLAAARLLPLLFG